jgi:16S rRNA A1518/A1519 N6-dimethyltransferase RsmA/KsgA/DIM1 with predicted DNA glycosylase/AP lyase activity
VLYNKHPFEVNLEETRQMVKVTPPDIAGFEKHRTLYDDKMVSNLPYNTFPILRLLWSRLAKSV